MKLQWRGRRPQRGGDELASFGYGRLEGGGGNLLDVKLIGSRQNKDGGQNAPFDRMPVSREAKKSPGRY